MQRRHDFLELSYDGLGFLVDRDSFFSSLYLERESGIVEFNGDNIFTFNMDRLLGREFKLKESESLKLALICDTEGYTEESRKKFSGLVKELDDISTRYIALKIGSQAEINSILLDEIKLIPVSLRKRLLNEGLLGCRFRKPEYPQFLIDLEAFVFNSSGIERKVPV